MIQICCDLFSDKIRDPLDLGVTFAEGFVGTSPAVFLQTRSCTAGDENKIAGAIKDGVLALDDNLRLGSKQVIHFCPFCGTKIVIRP